MHTVVINSRKLTGTTQSTCLPAWYRLQPLWYMASSAVLSGVGAAFVMLGPWARRSVSARWPWTLFGANWLLQGVASWLADVTNLGHESVWHVVDTRLALVTLAFSTAYGCAWLFGAFGFARRDSGLISLTSRALALGCMASALHAKAMSARAQRARDPSAYFFAHARWHYSLAFGLCVPLLDGVL